MSSNVGVIGAGAWGTAVAKVIADKGHKVAIWSHEEQTTQNINTLHENIQFLPEVKLPSQLSASTDMVTIFRSSFDLFVFMMFFPFDD